MNFAKCVLEVVDRRPRGCILRRTREPQRFLENSEYHGIQHYIFHLNNKITRAFTFRRRAFLEKRLEQVVLGGGREVESGEHVACIAQRVVSRLLDRPHAANTAESREERAHHCSAPSGCVLLQNISASRTNLLC